MVYDKEKFHSVIAKGLFIGNRSRPDILTTISVLSSRVKVPNKDDWLKARRLVHYLKETKDIHLILKYDATRINRWHVDASFTVHEDFRSHSGGLMKISEEGGVIAAGSTKQKLNVRSSTVAKLVAVDDFLSKIMWISRFLEVLGYPLKQNVLLQDNTSAILMQKNGRTCLGKRNRAIDVRYFAIKDLIDKGEVCIEYCDTENMIADFKPNLCKGKSSYDLEK